MFNGTTHGDLLKILAAVEPVDLKGLALLRKRSRQRQPRSGGWFPADVDSRKVAEAASEMIDYMHICRRSMDRLAVLQPVSVIKASFEEFSI